MKVTKHKKLLKSEKTKTKLKERKLPKGLNITDASFKTKKIVISKQLKEQSESDILSRRKLDIKALLQRVKHHNLKSRLAAIKELKEILSKHDPESVCSPLQPLLQGILAVSLDKEKDIRREALRTANVVLSKMSGEHQLFYSNIIIPYLGCMMTNINPSIREDSLLLLDLFVNNCNELVARNSEKILPNFLDLISRLRTESQPGRQLTTTLSSKISSMKWTTKVLTSLAKILDCILKNARQKICENEKLRETTVAKEALLRTPIFVNRSLIQACEFDFDDEQNENFDEGFLKYTNELVPLMLDCWKEKNSARVLSFESFELLRSIFRIIHHMIEYAEILEVNLDEEKCCFSQKIRDNLKKAFLRIIFENFPYELHEAEVVSRKKHQELEGKASRNCMQENFSFCQLVIWVLKGTNSGIDKEWMERILHFLTEKIAQWSYNDNECLTELGKVLKILFLQASENFYKNKRSLKKILETIFNVYESSKNKNLRAQVFELLKDIAMNRNLGNLHREKTFQKFVSSLPPLLMEKQIQDETVKLLNHVVLSKTAWVKDYLVKHEDQIIDNSKTIEIIGSKNVYETRLMICNLFYFISGTTYF